MNRTRRTTAAYATPAPGLTGDENGMKRTINSLIQLQELLEARAQHETTTAGAHLARLDESIRAMVKALPEELRPQFIRLRKKSHLAIVPVVNSSCAACGMNLPVSLANEVRRSEALHRCPNCARFLFWPDAALPRRVMQEAVRYGAAKVGLARFSAPELMAPVLTATSKEGAIQELCAKLEAEGFVDSGARLTEEVLRRETIVSTAIENGIAFPHARGVEGGGLSLALGLAPKGIRFTSEFRRLTRIVFLMSIPTAASAFYLKLLAGLTKALELPENQQKLFDAETPEELWKTLLQLTRRTIP